MPLVNIDTSLPATKVPAGFILRLSKVIAETLNKDEARVMVTLNTDKLMCRAGDNSPSLIMRINFIGELDEAKNKRCTEAYFKLIHSETNLPISRINVVYTLISKDQLCIVPSTL